MSEDLAGSDCRKLIRPLFDRLVERNREAIAAALGGEFSDELEQLAAAAVESGCRPEEARSVIIQLAREYEGARGAVFD